MKRKARGWLASSDRAKLKFRLRMQKGKHFRERWDKDPEFMRRMLEITIAKNRQRWKAGRERAEMIARHLPSRTHSSEFRQRIANAILEVDGRDQTTAKEIHAVLVSLRRLGLVSFDPGTLTWVRLSKCDNEQ